MNRSLQTGVFLSKWIIDRCAGQYANILNQSDISEFNMKNTVNGNFTKTATTLITAFSICNKKIIN